MGCGVAPGRAHEAGWGWRLNKGDWGIAVFEGRSLGVSLTKSLFRREEGKEMAGPRMFPRRACHSIFPAPSPCPGAATPVSGKAWRLESGGSFRAQPPRSNPTWFHACPPPPPP